MWRFFCLQLVGNQVVVVVAVATVLGTLAAMVVVPLKSLGPDGWKIAAALMARHIGGGQTSCSSLITVGRSLCYFALSSATRMCSPFRVMSTEDYYYYFSPFLGS